MRYIFRNYFVLLYAHKLHNTSLGKIVLTSDSILFFNDEDTTKTTLQTHVDS